MERSTTKPRFLADLTEDEQAYIIKHFKNTLNAELARKIGISETTLHRFARMHGLKKTPQFVHKCQMNAAVKAKESNLRNGTYPPKGYIIPGSVETRFKSGPRKEHWKKKKARIAKANATWRERRNRDIMLISLGRPQETRHKIGAEAHFVVCQRRYLRKRGYIVERGSHTAYYDENTRRSELYENRKKGDRGYVWFEYKHISEKPQRKEE